MSTYRSANSLPSAEGKPISIYEVVEPPIQIIQKFARRISTEDETLGLMSIIF